jgi:hypothetical protein
MFSDRIKTISAVILVVCVLIFVGEALGDHRRLPGKVASHFDENGMADGWMSRSAFTGTMLAVGIGLPLLIMGIMYSFRIFPVRYSTISSSSYWRDPGGYEKACDFLFVSSFWFGSALLLWQTWLCHMLAEANLVSPPRLDRTEASALTVLLLVFSFAWPAVLIVCLLRSGRRRS